MKGSILDDIKGIGPATRNKLLQHFGSVENIKSASYDELEEITGFDKVKIRLLLMKLREKKLISNGRRFTGAKAGWFITAKGHPVASYSKYKKEE